jgi:hypothetical protein
VTRADDQDPLTITKAALARLVAVMASEIASDLGECSVGAIEVVALEVRERLDRVLSLLGLPRGRS